MDKRNRINDGAIMRRIIEGYKILAINGHAKSDNSDDHVPIESSDSSAFLFLLLFLPRQFYYALPCVINFR